MNEQLALEVVEFADLEILEEALAPNCDGFACGCGQAYCGGGYCGC